MTKILFLDNHPILDLKREKTDKPISPEKPRRRDGVFLSGPSGPLAALWHMPVPTGPGFNALCTARNTHQPSNGALVPTILGAKYPHSGYKEGLGG